MGASTPPPPYPPQGQGQKSFRNIIFVAFYAQVHKVTFCCDECHSRHFFFQLTGLTLHEQHGYCQLQERLFYSYINRGSYYKIFRLIVVVPNR